MEELLRTIVQQNKDILSALGRIAESLEPLGEVKASMAEVQSALEWTDAGSTAGQVLQSLESISDLILTIKP